MVGPEDVYLKLVREGDTFYAYASLNQIVWRSLGSHTFANLLGADMYVGLAVTSHQAGTLATAVFDGINLNAKGIAGCQAVQQEPPEEAPQRIRRNVEPRKRAPENGLADERGPDGLEPGVLRKLFRPVSGPIPRAKSPPNPQPHIFTEIFRRRLFAEL